MFILSLFVRGVSTPVGLKFRSREAADAAVAAVGGIVDRGSVEDEFGQEVFVSKDSLMMAVVTDVSRDFQAQAELQKAAQLAQRGVSSGLSFGGGGALPFLNG